MVRLFEFQDLDKITDMWLQGSLEAHFFIDIEYWKRNFDSVKSVLPNAEVYVYEENRRILRFTGMDAEYIVGIFVTAEYKEQGIGHQLTETAKRKKRLSLYVLDKNTGAMASYSKKGFVVREKMTEKETGESEYLAVYESGE